MGANQCTVVNTITREGSIGPETLGSWPLDEPWTDGLFYFISPTFRRSGKYTITFTIEPQEGYIGPTLSFVKPLSIVINVQAREKICGVQDACSKLEALYYVHKAGRRSMIDRIRYGDFFENRLADKVENRWTELDACKSAILTVFAALPQGSLLLDSEDEAYTGAPTGIDEALGWNDILEDAWYDSLERASSAQELMECLIILEYYICKAWLEMPQTKLYTSLPSPHFAIRAATLSSVSLRLFCLDKAMKLSAR